MNKPQPPAQSGGELVIPALTGQNWPSYILQSWLTLRGLGIADERIRYIPEFGHFTAPEICGQEPAPPAYDPRSGRITVNPVDPATVRPRLTVNVRSDTVVQFLKDGMREVQVGRLAHFFEPMVTGIPGHDADWRLAGDGPMDRLVRHIGESYPELIAVPPYAIMDRLIGAVDTIVSALTESDRVGEAHRLAEVADRLGSSADRAECVPTFDAAVHLLPALQDPNRSRGVEISMTRWKDALFQAASRTRSGSGYPSPPAPLPSREREGEGSRRGSDSCLDAITGHVATLSQSDREHDALMMRELLDALTWLTLKERNRVLREIMEIMTTIAFMTSAAIDARYGMFWINGPIDDIRLPVSPSSGVGSGESQLGGLLMSVTGGMHSQSVVAAALARWAAQGAVLGVGSSPVAPSDPSRLDLNVLDASEQLELWSLAAWRRTTPDPIALLETAARRLLHPESQVTWDQFANLPSQFGMLTAQPGRTAVLAGRGEVQYPGLVVAIPIAEDEDERAKPILDIILRLFAPVCLRVEIVWKSAVGRLGQSYLHHDFQEGVRFADDFVALQEYEAAATT